MTPAAALAVWQARLGHLLGLDKLAWNDILPKYEPFKYGSFAVNAGDGSYRITAEIQRLLGESEANGHIGGLPPILAFSSVIDATVSAPSPGIWPGAIELRGERGAPPHSVLVAPITSIRSIERNIVPKSFQVSPFRTSR